MAQDFNKVILTGRLTRDPELKMLGEDSVVCNFGLAVNRPKRNDEEIADFFEVAVWGKQAENLANWKKKGDPVLVEGVLQYRTWEAQDGSKRSMVSIRVFSIQFLNRGGQQNGGGSDQGGGDEVDLSEEDFDDIPF